MEKVPQRIGHYRVLSRLGSGGMGEVLLAQDEQLARRVAIKRIRHDACEKPAHRERFRREARFAARLNHPGIVQIYDLLTEGDADHLVLEYVDGTDLRTILHRGPLPVAQALDLARQIARGLQEAHRQGLVHRDLKTENILVTPSGQAKIADFGIAKLMAEEGEGEESLTRADAVVGTYRAMSPEQARGEPVDHRSDLFAFGVLLYEMLTGRSPFETGNALSTLDRIARHHPSSVRDLSPAVPEPLSRLVDHLLEKDPALRPRSAGEVARDLDEIATAAGGLDTEIDARTVTGTATVALPTGRATVRADSALETVHRRPSLRALAAVIVAALLGLGGFLILRPPPSPLYVGVLAPRIGSGGENQDLTLLATDVRVALLQALVAMKGVSLKSFDEVDETKGSPPEVARAVSADELVRSSLDCRSETCLISLSRLDARGKVLWGDSFEVPADDLSLIARAVIQHLQVGYPDHPRKEGEAQRTGGADDLRQILEIRRKLDSGPGAPFDEILAGLEALRRRVPDNLDVHLLEAQAARRRFAMSRDPADLRRATEAVQRARELAPNDAEPQLLQADIALASQDLTTVERTLALLDRSLPGDVRVLDRRWQWLNAQGKSEEALAVLRRAARLNPSVKRLANLAQLEMQLGDVAEARSHLELLLQRSPHSAKGLSLMATLELLHGDLHRAIDRYQDLLRVSPGLVQASNLGFAYLLLGDYAHARTVFEKAVKDEPGNPSPLLNLADVCLLSGRLEEARVDYLEVVRLVQEDPESGSPALLTVKAQALAHLGRGPEAATAVLEALRLAPAQGPVAYEASLVYALLGEPSSAVANARKALSLGVAPRLFDLPWFQPIQDRPEFVQLFASNPTVAKTAAPQQGRR
jgi:serine/threonine-protein kinase